MTSGYRHDDGRSKSEVRQCAELFFVLDGIAQLVVAEIRKQFRSAGLKDPHDRQRCTGQVLRLDFELLRKGKVPAGYLQPSLFG